MGPQSVTGLINVITYWKIMVCLYKKITLVYQLFDLKENSHN